jgi:hypothetical protein
MQISNRILTFMRIRIQILIFTLMRIWIRVPKDPMQIHNTAQKTCIVNVRECPSKAWDELRLVAEKVLLLIGS